MTNTLGSQVLGSWYDIIGYIVFSSIFFYLGRAGTLPTHVQKRMPAILQNRELCAFLGICFAVTALYKGVNNDVPKNSLPATAIAAFAGEPEWARIGNADEGDSLSIDNKTVIRNGVEIEYTEQLLFKSPTTFPQPLGEVAELKSRLLINCIERSKVRLEILVTKPDGSVRFQDNRLGTPIKTSISNDPSTSEYISSNYLCAQTNIIAKQR